MLSGESNCGGAVAEWVSTSRSSGSECRIGDQVVPSSNPAVTTSLRNFGNYVYPALPVSFRIDLKIRRSLLFGIYARGSTNIPHRVNVKCVTCRGLHHS